LYDGFHVGLIFIFSFSSLGVYGIIVSGWSSNSKYSFLGSLRSAAQLISYEVSMAIIIMPIFMSSCSLNLTEIVLSQNEIFFFFPFFPSFICFFISLLAETNRVPFDLPEAESELVSGYHVEYSSSTFVFFFLAEYSNILLMGCLIVILFFGGWLPIFNLYIFFFFPGWFWFFFKLIFFLFFFVLVRGTLPRYRYDQLMELGWKYLMPFSIIFVYFFYFLLNFFYN
jgi:NADH-quinone oxidoreductase subunit H